jgi:hypothetical protein
MSKTYRRNPEGFSEGARVEKGGATNIIREALLELEEFEKEEKEDGPPKED